MEVYKKKILKEEHFRFSDDLTSWINKNIDVDQIVSISHTHNWGDKSYIVWYWEYEK